MQIAQRNKLTETVWMDVNQKPENHFPMFADGLVCEFVSVEKLCAQLNSNNQTGIHECDKINDHKSSSSSRLIWRILACTNTHKTQHKTHTGAASAVAAAACERTDQWHRGSGQSAFRVPVQRATSRLCQFNKMVWELQNKHIEFVHHPLRSNILFSELWIRKNKQRFFFHFIHFNVVLRFIGRWVCHLFTSWYYIFWKFAERMLVRKYLFLKKSIEFLWKIFTNEQKIRVNSTTYCHVDIARWTSINLAMLTGQWQCIDACTSLVTRRMRI